jgi:hypothetical protein
LKISFQNPFCVFSSQFSMKRQTYSVRQKHVNTNIVAGDHTRTISVAAPTVGGLMKFAVKTQTCLGCKTPLPKGISIETIDNRCQ